MFFIPLLHCRQTPFHVPDVLFGILKQFFLEFEMFLHIFTERGFKFFERGFPKLFRLSVEPGFAERKQLLRLRLSALEEMFAHCLFEFARILRCECFQLGAFRISEILRFQSDQQRMTSGGRRWRSSVFRRSRFRNGGNEKNGEKKQNFFHMVCTP